jgi:hypothetical protein
MLILISLLLACLSPEEQLAEKRGQLTTGMEELYAAYGGSDVAKAVDGAARSAGVGDTTARTFGEMLGNMAVSVDRELFESQCLDLGAGNKPATLTDRARDFFAKDSTRTSCTRLAKLTREVDALEKQVERKKQ